MAARPSVPALACVIGALVALAGCGSEEDVRAFPAAAEPSPSPPLAVAPAGEVRRNPDARGSSLGPRRTARAPDTGDVVRLLPRERVLELIDPRTGRARSAEPAGVGPTQVVAGGDARVYVADTAGGAVLLLRTRPRLRVVRRVGLEGSPYAMAVDRRRGRLWVTLTGRNEVVEVTEAGLPRELRRFPTLRSPVAVGVDEASGRVLVASPGEAELQTFDPARALPAP